MKRKINNSDDFSPSDEYNGAIDDFVPVEFIKLSQEIPDGKSDGKDCTQQEYLKSIVSVHVLAQVIFFCKIVI
jgi:hypothetical protein